MKFLTQLDERFPRHESVLNHKKVLFCGDSICAASVYDYKDCTFWGWAGRLSASTGLSYINKGRDGASLSTCRQDNRVLMQIEACKDERFDLVVLHGGVNDGWDSNAVGTVAAGFELPDFDTATCAGGLEELFFTAKKYFPTSKLCFIVNFSTPSSTIGRLSDMNEYFETIIAVCKKWNIPYLDLYHDKDFAEHFKVAEKINTADFVHPNGQGYDLLYPVIEKFLEKQF